MRDIKKEIELLQKIFSNAYFNHDSKKYKKLHHPNINWDTIKHFIINENEIEVHFNLHFNQTIYQNDVIKYINERFFELNSELKIFIDEYPVCIGTPNGVLHPRMYSIVIKL